MAVFSSDQSTRRSWLHMYCSEIVSNTQMGAREWHISMCVCVCGNNATKITPDNHETLKPIIICMKQQRTLMIIYDTEMTHVMNITRQSITICVRIASGNHDMRGTCEWTHSLLSSPLLSFPFLSFPFLLLHALLLFTTCDVVCSAPLLSSPFLSFPFLSFFFMHFSTPTVVHNV